MFCIFVPVLYVLYCSVAEIRSNDGEQAAAVHDDDS